MKILIQKDTYTLTVHSSPIYNDQDMEQPKRPSTDEQIKMWYIYPMKCCSVKKKKKKNEIRPFATKRVELNITILSQIKKDKHHMISLICGI